MLNAAVSGITLASEWSNSYVFIYRKVYDGSTTTMAQVNYGVDAYLTISAPVTASSLYKSYNMIQYAYDSGSTINTVILDEFLTYSATGEIFSHFAASHLDALTITDSGVYSSYLVNGYVYYSSNYGYIQLGENTVTITASSSDPTYNVGFYKTLTANFSLPSGYGVAIASNSASIKTVAENVQAHFLVDGVSIQYQELTVGTDGKVATGTETTSISLSGLSIPNSIDSSLSIKVYIKKANYIDYVEASFNSYNYSLSVSNSGFNNTTDVSNGTSSFRGDSIEKTKTATFTYTLTYFTFSDGNYFTDYGIEESISETKSYSSNYETSTLECVSSVDVATLSATMDMWCEYNWNTGTFANHDGKFYHKWKLSKSLSSTWEHVTASVTASGQLRSYYFEEETNFPDIYDPMTEKDITVSTMEEDVTGSTEYQLGYWRTHLVGGYYLFIPEFMEEDLITAYSFTINNSDVTTIVNNGIELYF